jgi:hypothetical protein
MLFSPAIPNDANRNQLICKYISNSTVSNMHAHKQYQIVFMDYYKPPVLQKLHFSVSRIYLMRKDYIFSVM